MEKRIPKKTYRNIMNSLGGGTVPKEGLGYITVGRAQEIDSLLRDTEVIQDGGATFRFVVGDYGSGKTFLLQTIKEYCVKNDFIVAEVDLSPDRSLIGNTTKKKGLATYRELMANVSNKANQSGRALSKVIESWVNKMFERAAIELTQNPGGETNIEHIAEGLMLQDCAKLQSLAYGFEFSEALKLFWKASRTADMNEKLTGQESVLRWFRGEIKTNQETVKLLNLPMEGQVDRVFVREGAFCAYRIVERLKPELSEIKDKIVHGELNHAYSLIRLSAGLGTDPEDIEKAVRKLVRINLA